ncbi:AraC family transcriptional regulator [Listeria floridensis FSL S10-1187]|uniref:AraC family transcriptional regulator n=1 Tax=Listeria floridensis FSL S10-1187 TaxID=1265817 RepID=A0ABN0RDU3_9LIST|nr:AraC family transcriptional regulator [Listeria floridensis]EUJ30272.1 AraC family transcriptional regulator [Listeria floridensis FSL S10-1187]
MGNYLEIPNLNKEFPFRVFTNDGEVLVYPHWHKEIELIYVIHGSLNLGINDVPIELHAGEIQIINGGDVHYFLASPNSERIVIQFDLALFQAEDLLNQTDTNLRKLFSERALLSRTWGEQIEQQVGRLIQEMLLESEAKQAGHLYSIKAKLFELITLMYRSFPTEPSKQKSVLRDDIVLKSQETLEKLDEIFSYVEANYQNPITLQEVADEIGFSSYYFTKFFKRNAGMTFVTFLNDYRLNKAKWILLNEEIPIIEVAEKVGFSSVKTFHHTFKRAMGMAPLKYRKTIYGNNRTRK